MLNINVETDILEARRNFDASLDAIKRSEKTFNSISNEFYKVRENLIEVRKRAEKDIEIEIAKQMIKKIFKIFKGLAGIASGNLNGWFWLEKFFNRILINLFVCLFFSELVGSFDVFTGIVDYGDTMLNLAQTVSDIENFIKSSNEMLIDLQAPYKDSLRGHFQSIEAVVQLRVNIIKWENLKNAVNGILSKPPFATLGGVLAYKKTFLDLTNWGKALTKSAIERADLFRHTYQLKMLLESKKEQSIRYHKYLKKIEDGTAKQIEMRTLMIQQTFDIRIDLNEALVTFCEAYFYENQSPCNPNYRPQFGGSLTELLLRINAARRDAMFISTHFSFVSREVVIKNTKNNDTECTDSLICPINYLKKNQQIIWNLPLNHENLLDLYKYRVAEISLKFIGAKTKNNHNTKLKTIIESSGDFKGRGFNRTFNFVTRPLRLSYEYDINNCKIFLFIN